MIRNLEDGSTIRGLNIGCISRLVRSMFFLFEMIGNLLTQLSRFITLGSGKITPDRINRLEAMGFEWDPQKAQWNMMYDKLLKYKEEAGHCKVPKVSFAFHVVETSSERNPNCPSNAFFCSCRVTRRIPNLPTGYATSDWNRPT